MNKRAQLYKYKGNRCSSCGISINDMLERYGTFERVFELHHIDPNKKDDNYNNLIKQKLSSKQLEEVDKCVLLCRICHGLIHAQNVQVKASVSVEYEERTVSQDLSGWLMVDIKSGQTKFFCEERLLLTRYFSKLNDQKPTLLFGTDLNDGSYYAKAIDCLETGDAFQIYHAETGELMLKATKSSAGLELDINIKFGFIEIDASKAPKGHRFWYRNGYLLQENGEIQTEGMFKVRPNKLLKSDG